MPMELNACLSKGEMPRMWKQDVRKAGDLPVAEAWLEDDVCLPVERMPLQERA